MTSDRQIKANQENAKLGGVKTEEGKQKVRFNALKHGIWGRLISEYESDLYQDFLQNLVEEIKPIGMIEDLLVERLAVAYLRLYRLAKAEREFIDWKLNPDVMPEPTFEFAREGGYSPKITHEAVGTMFVTFSRYETSIENRFYRALREIKELRNGFVL